MLRYEISTGLIQKKNNLKKYVAGGIVSFAVAGAMAVPAMAATTSTGGGGGWNPPTDQCNAGHGVFKYFSDPSQHFTAGQPPYFGDDVRGSARAGATGATNSGASQACNQTP